VIGFDEDVETVRLLGAGHPPVAEPGLRELIETQLKEGRLSFSSKPADLEEVEVMWVAYDTPVDDDDHADVSYVTRRVQDLFPFIRSGALVVISSQVPVGSTRQLEQSFALARPETAVRFAYSPENLRLGKALEVFLTPERIVVGVRDQKAREQVAALLSPVTDKIEWMAVESAEMTKHGLNAFLATSVAFINELAGLCERVGADAAEVARALKSDVRIGPRAYLNPGAAFAGGTLARDLSFLSDIGARVGRPTSLLSSVAESNAKHRQWPLVRIKELMPDITGTRIAVLGLTYKPGTDTLRRSTSVEICRDLNRAGASVAGYDPGLSQLPSEVAHFVHLEPSAEMALRGAAALVVATDHPPFRSLRAEDIVRWMKHPLVIDPSGFLEAELGKDVRIRYLKVGKSA
jgi:UDPglucose 6-dehydrogenase